MAPQCPVSAVPNRHEKRGIFPLAIPVEGCHSGGSEPSLLALPATPSRLVVASRRAPMDGSRFDTLTRVLSAPGSRRRALGGLLASALALVNGDEAEEVAAHDA